MEKINVAIVGATGAVGEAMREILEERDFPIDELVLLASERSAGKRLQFHGKSVRVTLLDDFDFSNTLIIVKMNNVTFDEWKKENLKIIQKRLNGWQLESFKESYNHKVNKGITLYKKANQK